MTQLAFAWPGEEDRLDMDGRDRELVRQMELRTYGCGADRFHAAHPIEYHGVMVQCPGLVARPCGQNGLHGHHRWAEPEAFFWCQPFNYLRPSESADSVSRRS
jgi:hypothetical protein